MVEPLEVQIEAAVGELHLRAGACGCGQMGAVLAGCDRAGGTLWVTLEAVAPDELPDAFSRWLAHLEDPEWQQTAEHGIAMYGAVWEKLPHTESVRQAIQFATSPEFLDDVPTEEVWACRGVVWGRDDITRTAVALASLKGAYHSGGAFYPEIVKRMRKLPKP